VPTLPAHPLNPPLGIAQVLAASPGLTTLRLERCCIGGWRRARAIARGLLHNTSITELQLGYNGLGAATFPGGVIPLGGDGPAGGPGAGGALNNVPGGADVASTHAPGLGGAGGGGPAGGAAGIPVAGGHAAAPGGAAPLGESPASALNLSANTGGGTEGACACVCLSDPPVSLAIDALCQAIRSNSHLRILGLAHNSLGDAGATAIAVAALDSPSLLSLDLQANYISLPRLEALGATLELHGAEAVPLIARWGATSGSRRQSLVGGAGSYSGARGSFYSGAGGAGSAHSSRSSASDAAPYAASPSAGRTAATGTPGPSIAHLSEASPPPGSTSNWGISGASIPSASIAGASMPGLPRLRVDLRGNVTLDMLLNGADRADAPPLVIDVAHARAAAVAAAARTGAVGAGGRTGTSTGEAPHAEPPPPLVETAWLETALVETGLGGAGESAGAESAAQGAHGEAGASAADVGAGAREVEQAEGLTVSRSAWGDQASASGESVGGKPHATSPLAASGGPPPTGICQPWGHLGTAPPQLAPCTSASSSSADLVPPPAGILIVPPDGIIGGAGPVAHPGASPPPESPSPPTPPAAAHDNDPTAAHASALPAAAAAPGAAISSVPAAPAAAATLPPARVHAPADDLGGEEERAAVASAERWAWQLRQRRVALNPHYMSRQPEVRG
jgi:hypothetical protein